MAHSFRDLKIWQKGYNLLMEIYQITANYPREERFGLITDTRRSANSVIANIAEAHGRYYFAEIKQGFFIRQEVRQRKPEAIFLQLEV